MKGVQCMGLTVQSNRTTRTARTGIDAIVMIDGVILRITKVNPHVTIKALEIVIVHITDVFLVIIVVDIEDWVGHDELVGRVLTKRNSGCYSQCHYHHCHHCQHLRPLLPESRWRRAQCPRCGGWGATDR